jgi:hypothetical protein
MLSVSTRGSPEKAQIPYTRQSHRSGALLREVSGLPPPARRARSSMAGRSSRVTLETPSLNPLGGGQSFCVSTAFLTARPGPPPCPCRRRASTSCARSRPSQCRCYFATSSQRPVRLARRRCCSSPLCRQGMHWQALPGPSEIDGALAVERDGDLGAREVDTERVHWPAATGASTSLRVLRTPRAA